MYRHVDGTYVPLLCHQHQSVGIWSIPLSNMTGSSRLECIARDRIILLRLIAVLDRRRFHHLLVLEVPWTQLL